MTPETAVLAATTAAYLKVGISIASSALAAHGQAEVEAKNHAGDDTANCRPIG
jgi:hypothetical protein